MGVNKVVTQKLLPCDGIECIIALRVLRKNKLMTSLKYIVPLTNLSGLRSIHYCKLSTIMAHTLHAWAIKPVRKHKLHSTEREDRGNYYM